jgi:O-antigen/teichoic acid export membrane protein
VSHDEPGPDIAGDRAATASSATTGASVARGGVWEIAGNLLPQVYVFVVSAVVARHLGASVFGRVVLIAGVQSAVTVITPWGIPLSLIRHVGQLVGAGRAAQLQALLAWSYRIAVLAAVVGFSFMLGAALTGARPTSAWVLAGLSAAAAILQSVPSAFLIGSQRWSKARITGIVSGGCSMVAKIVALALGGGIVTLFAIDLVIMVANLAGTALLAALHQRSLGREPVAPPLKRDILRFAGVVGFSGAANLVLYQRTEIFVLAHYRTDADLALYSVPFAFVTALLLLPAATSSALSPAVATLWGAGDIQRIRSGYARGLRLMLILALTLGGLAAAVGPALIRLVYGPAFDNVRLVLFLLVLSVPIIPLGTMSASVLRAMGVLRWMTIVGAAAAVANVGLAFLLIPPFGPAGAAGANSIAQIGATLPLVVYAVRRLGGVPLPVSEALRGGVTVVAAVTVANLVASTLPTGVALVVAFAVFVVVAVVVGLPLRVLKREDRAWVRETAAQAFGRRLRFRSG